MRDYERETISHALIRIGDGPVDSLENGDAPALEAAKALLPQVADELTGNWEWSFARERAVIEADNYEPDETNTFELPEDLLTLFSVKDVDDYSIEGRTLRVFDEDEVEIIYIRSLVDVDEDGEPQFVVTPLPPVFLSALSCRLASELAGQFAGNMELQQVLMQEYSELLRQARGQDAMQFPSDDPPSDWTEIN